MNKDVSTMTVEQLKALAYDFLVQIEVAQKNLQVVNQEIANKSQPGAKVEPAVEPEIVVN